MCDSILCVHTRPYDCFSSADAIQFTRSAVATTGIKKFTYGNISHEIQARDLPRLCWPFLVKFWCAHVCDPSSLPPHSKTKHSAALSPFPPILLSDSFTIHSLSLTLSLSLSLSLSLTDTHTLQGFICSLLPSFIMDHMSWKFMKMGKARYLKRKAKATYKDWYT